MKSLTVVSLIAIALLSLTLVACGSISGTLPPAAGASAPDPTATALPRAATNVPAPTATPSNLMPVNFENISFRYDPKLANEVKAQAVPGMTEFYVPYDAYRFDFSGYDSKSPVQPHVWVFASNAPESDLTKKAISALKSNLADRTDPGKTLPAYLTGPSVNGLVLPVFVPINARPVLSTQWSRVDGSGASGLRVVTMYSQGIGTVDPNALVYAYSGLNPDGSVAFAAAFPVRPASPLSLPAADTKSLLNDLTMLDAYNRQVADLIAKLGPSDFTPDLRLIDQTLASLSINGSLPAIKVKSVNRIVIENCTRDGMINEVSAEAGYCFLFPPRFVLKELGNGAATITGPALDKSPDPLKVTLGVEVKSAAGKTLAQLADAYLKDNSAPTLKTQRTNLTLGGEPAVMLEPLAGRPTFRAVLVVHGDKLMVLRFSPDAAGFPQAKPDLTELYEAVTKSFTFLPIN